MPNSIARVKDFYKFSSEFYKNPRIELKDLSYIDTYLDNPGGRREFLVVHDDFSIKGVLGFSHQDTKHKWLLTTVSVHPDHYGSGLSTLLFDSLIQRSIESKKAVINTEYTEEGLLYFKPNVKSIIDKYPKAIFVEDNFLKNCFHNAKLFDSKNIKFSQLSSVYFKYINEITKIAPLKDTASMSYEDSASYAKMVWDKVEELNETLINPLLKKVKKNNCKP